MGNDRPLPSDIGAERAVLGAILLDNQVLALAEAHLDPGAWAFRPHLLVYEAMRVVAAQGMAVDAVTVGAEMRRRATLDKVPDGALFLGKLTDGAAVVANADHYVRIVRERAAMRRVIVRAQEVAERALGGSDLAGVERGVEAVVAAAQELARTRMPHSLLAMGPDVLAMYDQVAQGYRGIPLPWPTLDAMTAGMWPKTLSIFVARPSIGKTWLGVLAGRHAWRKGFRVLIISPEMSREEIAERFFAVEAGVSYMNIVRGTLSDFERPSLEQAAAACQAAEGLWIMDSRDDLTPRGMEAAIRACAPQLVAVDSIYDLRVKGERRDRLLLALEWMRTTAKEYAFAAVGFAQQNRLAEMDPKKGGGSRLGTIALADEIGQDAHAVFALEQDKDLRLDRRMRIKPLKMRRGHAGGRDAVEVHWDFEAMRFEEVEGQGGDAYVDDEPPF